MPHDPMSGEVLEISDFRGVPLGDLTGAVTTRAWNLNSKGKAIFIIPKNTAEERLIRFGNKIHIKHTTAGSWGGVIYTSRKWGEDSIEVTSYTAEALLGARFTTGDVTGTASEIFEELIGLGNSRVHMQIDLTTTLESVGESFTQVMKHTNLYSVIFDIAKKTGQDWFLEPAIREDGRLYFQAGWQEQRGLTHSYTLKEGENVRQGKNAGLLEQGDIINSLLLNTYTDTTTAQVTAEDPESIALHGLWEGVINAALPSGYTPQTYADYLVSVYANPRKTWTLEAIDLQDVPLQEHPFTYLGLGDILPLKMVRQGYTFGELGTETNIRVLGKELNLEDGFMSLTVEEV